MVVLAVAALVGIVWYLASRTSRSAAGSDVAAAAVNTSSAPTMTGVLANSTGPSRSTVPSPSPSPTASGSPVTSASPTAPAASPTATDPAATDPAAAGTAIDPATATETPITDTPPAAPVQTAPAAPPPPPPSYDADGRLLCADTSITLTAKAPATVKSGSSAIIGMSVTDSGTEACRRDVSGTIQVFTVFAADGTRMWSTADCFPGTGTEVRDLTPGQSLEYTVRWSGTTSTPGCVGERAPLPAGDYTLIAELGGLSSAPAAFTVG